MLRRMILRIPEAIGASVRGAVLHAIGSVAYVGGVARLLLGVGRRVIPGRTRAERFRFVALRQQSVRVGVRSLPIVMLVQLFIGIILSLNMAPVLESYGQLERVADIVAIAVLRELGPLITAILLSGFAGASIAAELGAMVEGEEIKALRSHALDPLRFLAVPRVLATMIMMIGLTVVANACGIAGGLITSYFVLAVSPQVYLDLTAAAVDSTDYLTGLFKAGVFGALIAGLACYEGFNVSGGAEGVGHSTTTTVVKSIVALILADTIFAAVFYVIGW